MLSPTLALRCPHCQHALALSDLSAAEVCPACRAPHGVPAPVVAALDAYERSTRQALAELLQGLSGAIPPGAAQISARGGGPGPASPAGLAAPDVPADSTRAPRARAAPEGRAVLADSSIPAPDAGAAPTDSLVAALARVGELAPPHAGAPIAAAADPDAPPRAASAAPLGDASPVPADILFPSSADATPAPTSIPAGAGVTPAPTNIPAGAAATPVPMNISTGAAATPVPTSIPAGAGVPPAPTNILSGAAATPVLTNIPAGAAATPVPTNILAGAAATPVPTNILAGAGVPPVPTNILAGAAAAPVPTDILSGAAATPVPTDIPASAGVTPAPPASSGASRADILTDAAPVPADIQEVTARPTATTSPAAAELREGAPVPADIRDASADPAEHEELSADLLAAPGGPPPLPGASASRLLAAPSDAPKRPGLLLSVASPIGVPVREGRIPAAALAVARRALLARHGDERRKQLVRAGGLGLVFMLVLAAGLVVAGLWYAALPIALLAGWIRLRREEHYERFHAEIERLAAARGGQRLVAWDDIAGWFDALWPGPIAPESTWTGPLHQAVRSEVDGYHVLLDVHLAEKTEGGVVYPPRVSTYLAAAWPGRVPSLRPTATDLPPAAAERLTRLRRAGYTIVADPHAGLSAHASEAAAREAREDLTRLAALPLAPAELAALARELGAEPAPPLTPLR